MIFHLVALCLPALPLDYKIGLVRTVVNSKMKKNMNLHGGSGGVISIRISGRLQESFMATFCFCCGK
jgi:hypothetical protein